MTGPKVLLTPEAFIRPNGGVRRYAIELERAIATFGDSERVGEQLGLRVARVAGRRLGGAVARLATDMNVRSLANSADLAHSAYYDCSSLGLRMPLIATFHDCIHERFQMSGPLRSAVLARHKRRSVERARIVLAISQATARDVAQFYDLEAQRIVVISPPVGPVFMNYENQPDRGGEYPFFLFVGRREAYKNWKLLVEAVGLLRDVYSDVRLVSVGGGPLSSIEMEELQSTGLRNGAHEWLSKIGDEELAKLYRDSVAVVCPSSYEGFGYPVAESLCTGGSAIASNGGSLAEFASVGCQIFENNNLESLRNVLEGALIQWGASTRPGVENRQAARTRFGLPEFRSRLSNLYALALRSA